jgi:hypothetical protein
MEFYMEPKRSFYRQGHRFRDEIGVTYSSILRLVRQAYDENLDEWFGWDHSGGDIGYLSNMMVVYVWTLFEELMRKAFIAIHDYDPPKEDQVRKNNRGWGEMRAWLIKRGMFSELKDFEPFVSELGARRNCLVHQIGLVDDQYIQQASKYGGKPAFAEGERVWTDHAYHKQIEKKLIYFEMVLQSEAELYPREGKGY